jgi:hypothetical protein
MDNATRYTCEKCGKQHEEWPALAYFSPAYYHELPAHEKANAELNSDFCTIHHPNQTDRFIRASLTLKVIDHCEDLDYGLWVSLSEKSFTDYTANYENTNYEASYFGWISNILPDYPDTRKVPTTVYTQTGGKRPLIVPHEGFDHPFVKDYYNGIAKAEAERRIAEMIKITGADSVPSRAKRPWYRKIFGA